MAIRSNLLRGNRRDPGIVSVTVWEPAKHTDDDGNVISVEDGTAVVLGGWDIQPLMSSAPAILDSTGFAYVAGLQRAFLPVEHLIYWKAGRKVQDNSNERTYRMGPSQDWKVYGMIILEPSR